MSYNYIIPDPVMLSKRIIKIQSQMITVNSGSDNTTPLHFPKSPSTNKTVVNDAAKPAIPSTINAKIQSTVQYDNSIPLSSSPMTERFIHHLSTRLSKY